MKNKQITRVFGFALELSCLSLLSLSELIS
jgi:hypothetical protein